MSSVLRILVFIDHRRFIFLNEEGGIVATIKEKTYYYFVDTNC
jgi:hypothetical protein